MHYRLYRIRFFMRNNRPHAADCMWAYSSTKLYIIKCNFIIIMIQATFFFFNLQLQLNGNVWLLLSISWCWIAFNTNIYRWIFLHIHFMSIPIALIDTHLLHSIFDRSGSLFHALAHVHFESIYRLTKLSVSQQRIRRSTPVSLKYL